MAIRVLFHATARAHVPGGLWRAITTQFHREAGASMKNTFVNQIVLISGGAGGIGSATARLLIERGAHVVLADLDRRALEQVAAQLGASASTVIIDVTDPASCAAGVTAVLHEHGRLDAIWANAGISAFGPMELLDSNSWRRVIEVNLLGAYNLVHAALPAIIENCGYVAFTASWASFAHSPGHSAYAAAKAGLEAMANSLRSEVADQGVRVGVFHPGWIATPMVLEKVEHQAAFNTLLASLPSPLRKIAEPEALAKTLAKAFQERPAKVVYPAAGWLLHILRPLLATQIFTSSPRRAAPQIRRQFTLQKK
ncbi:SDR family NAD(P)-dependent oxidoreductase [Mycobacteroides abscessus]|uniref:SDR family NAD(P)-dependent oxidoreductase n=2 Tax=Mycobacteroides abscessus TaxID=36809 RepID=UPI000C266A22|nr:SDR family NAD(P)-dependent oxidoreductase [Mycobacteroides abscessus]